MRSCKIRRVREWGKAAGGGQEATGQVEEKMCLLFLCCVFLSDLTPPWYSLSSAGGLLEECGP